MKITSRFYMILGFSFLALTIAWVVRMCGEGFSIDIFSRLSAYFCLTVFSFIIYSYMKDEEIREDNL